MSLYSCIYKFYAYNNANLVLSLGNYWMFGEILCELPLSFWSLKIWFLLLKLLKVRFVPNANCHYRVLYFLFTLKFVINSNTSEVNVDGLHTYGLFFNHHWPFCFKIVSWGYKELKYLTIIGNPKRFLILSYSQLIALTHRIFLQKNNLAVFLSS